MNGVKYYRIQKGLTQKDLAKLADINPQVLARMEHMGIDSGLEGAMPDNYLMLRKVLCVPVDELVREDLPEDTETLYNRAMRPSRSECAENCIAVYRRAHRLTLRMLASVLEISHESLRQACAAEEPPEKYVDLLARHLGISRQEFIRQYAKGDS